MGVLLTYGQAGYRTTLRGNANTERRRRQAKVRYRRAHVDNPIRNEWPLLRMSRVRWSPAENVQLPTHAPCPGVFTRAGGSLRIEPGAVPGLCAANSVCGAIEAVTMALPAETSSALPASLRQRSPPAGRSPPAKLLGRSDLCRTAPHRWLTSQGPLAWGKRTSLRRTPWSTNTAILNQRHRRLARGGQRSG